MAGKPRKKKSLEERLEARECELRRARRRIRQLESRLGGDDSEAHGRAFLARLAESTNDIVYCINAEGIFTYISPQISRYGVPPEDIVSHPFIEFIHPDDIEPTMRDFQRTLETGEEYPTRFRIIDAAGEAHWMEEFGHIQRNEEGEIVSITGVLRDISERKRFENELNQHRERLEEMVEERTGELARANETLEKEVRSRRAVELALRASEQMYRLVVDTMGEGLAMVNHKGRLTFANDSLCRMTGYRKDDFLGTRIYAHVPRQDRGKLEQLLRRREKGEQETCELELITRDGNTRFVRISALPSFDEEDNFIGNVGLVTDLTQKQIADRAVEASGKRFRDLAESIGDIFYAMDSDLRLTYWNRASEEITDISARDAIGKRIQELFPDSRGAETAALYRRVLGSGKPESIEISCIKHEEEHILELSVYPSQEGVSVLGRDISERIHAERVIRRSEQRYRSIFNSAAVAIWEEDFSEAIARMRKLQASGVSDLRSYFDSHPEKFLELVMTIRVLDVNDTALRLYGAESREELFASLEKVLVPEALTAIREALICMAEGQREIATEGVNGTLDGRRLDVLKRAILPEDEEKFDSVLVSVMDVTDLKRAGEAVRRRAEFEFLIASFSSRFINMDAEEIDRGIEDALKAVGEFSGVDRSYLFQLSGDGALVSNTHEWCAKGIEPQKNSLQDIPVEGYGWFMTRLDKGESICINGLETMPEEARAERKLLEAQGIVSVVNVPIFYRDSLVGMLGFDSVSGKKEWPDESIALLRMVGEIFINALERTRMEKQLRRECDGLEVRVAESTIALRRSEVRLQERVRELTCLNRLRDEFNREQPLEDTLRNCAVYIRKALGDSENRVVAINLDGEQIVTKHTGYDDGSFLEGLIQIAGFKRGFVRVYSRSPGHSFLPYELDLARHAAASLGSLIQNRELVDQLVQTEKMAAAGRLAAGVAHEINNPLGAIKNSLYILRDLVDPSHKDYSYVEVMDAEIDRVAGIIAQLYNLYKPSASEINDVDLSETVGNVLKMLDSQVRRRKIKVQNEMPGGGPVLELSLNQLTQVIYNIILNSIQAMPRGGRLTIGGTRSEGVYELWVSDTGSGIPDEVLPHIFEPFFTTKIRGSTPTEGMGMGLSLSRTFMEAMGGTISVKTRAGWGTTFILGFPLGKKKRGKSAGRSPAE